MGAAASPGFGAATLRGSSWRGMAAISRIRPIREGQAGQSQAGRLALQWTDLRLNHVVVHQIITVEDVEAG